LSRGLAFRQSRQDPLDSSESRVSATVPFAVALAVVAPCDERKIAVLPPIRVRRIHAVEERIRLQEASAQGTWGLPR